LVGCLARGLSISVIADEMHLSASTVRLCLQTVLAKLDARATLEAVATAVREGLIPCPTADLP
jgi:DNA-binding NarL/FixJ family response regulator